jgi:2-dehydro-3-deoxyphosphogluconate aldolase / (4S)-4-hydroxy-2-oxoglutarate aldolase
MTKDEMLMRTEEIGIIPAERACSAGDALFVSEAILSSGIPVVEITMTTPGAVGVISELVRNGSDLIIGAGTVLDIDTAREQLNEGRSRLPPQHYFAGRQGSGNHRDIVLVRKFGQLVVKAGTGEERSTCIDADVCSSVGGPSYIRALRGPFPDTRFIASGGVTQQTAADYIRAGADVLGVGHDLLPPEAVLARNSDWIHELARRFIEVVKQGRKNHAQNRHQHQK